MSTQANKTNKTWLEKALALLNISEQDKLVLMKKRMEKYYKEEERKCNAHIERLERELEDYLETSTEKLDEIKEQEEQSFLEINLDKIATVELRDSFFHILQNHWFYYHYYLIQLLNIYNLSFVYKYNLYKSLQNNYL